MRAANVVMPRTGLAMLVGLALAVAAEVPGPAQVEDFTPVTETGEVLWEINLGSSVTGFPISYAVDGRQYVAVSTRVAGTSGGLICLTPELRPSAGNNLFVFALPD